MREVLEREWTPLNVPPRWEPVDRTDNKIFDKGGRVYAGLTGTKPDFTPFEAYLVVEEGRPVVDWEATTGRGTATYEELARGEGDGSFIRGSLLISEYYTAVYPERDYQSFRLISRNPEEGIWVYCRRGTQVIDDLDDLFRPGEILGTSQSEYRVCLALQPGAHGALPNQWEIVELLHIDWVSP
jgi:hypothetical protein